MSFAEIPNRLRFFIHPIPLGAIFIMALNDHWLKFQFGNFLTGKISDFCGVFYFPIFLLALIALVDEVFRLQRFRLGPKSAMGAIVFTDLLMFIVKLSGVGVHSIEIFFKSYLFPIQLISDPTDLFSLVMNPLTFYYLKSFWTDSK